MRYDEVRDKNKLNANNENISYSALQKWKCVYSLGAYGYPHAEKLSSGNVKDWGISNAHEHAHNMKCSNSP
jgi:hypothetical protein